jgi:hypothetical protein
MANVLDILVIDTHNINTLGIADNSTYDATPVSPTISITVPGFAAVVLPFVPNDFNVFNSASLGLSVVGDPLLPLPDGVYYLTYTIDPALTNFVNKTIMRVDKIQEKFDEAFMKLDMMQCDLAIKQQQKVELNSIYYFIQGSIAAANNCAVDTANKLYIQADKMLSNFIKNNCGCSGTNYFNSFV